MAQSDRTQLKQQMQAAIGDLRTVTNALDVVSRDAQRYDVQTIGQAALAANTNANIPVVRNAVAMLVKEVRILPGAAFNSLANPANTVVQYGYFPGDNGANAFTVMGSINTNTVANGGTGNWVAGTSIVVTANLSVNQTIPAGSQAWVQVLATAPSTAVGAGTAFQVLWEEV